MEGTIVRSSIIEAYVDSGIMQIFRPCAYAFQSFINEYQETEMSHLGTLWDPTGK